MSDPDGALGIQPDGAKEDVVGKLPQTTAQKLARLRLSPLFRPLATPPQGDRTPAARARREAARRRGQELETFAQQLVVRTYGVGARLEHAASGLHLVLRGAVAKVRNHQWSTRPDLRRAGAVLGASELEHWYRSRRPPAFLPHLRWAFVEGAPFAVWAVTPVETLHLEAKRFEQAFGSPADAERPGRSGPPNSLLARLLEFAELERCATSIVDDLSRTREFAHVGKPYLFELLWGARLREVEPPNTVDALRGGQQLDRGTGVLLHANTRPREYYYVREGALKARPNAQAPPGSSPARQYPDRSFVGLSEVLHDLRLPHDVVPAVTSRVVALCTAACRRLLELEGEFRVAIRANVKLGERWQRIRDRTGCQVVLVAPHPSAERPARAVFPELVEALGRRIQTHLRDNVLVLHLSGRSSTAEAPPDLRELKSALQRVHPEPCRPGAGVASTSEPPQEQQGLKPLFQCCPSPGPRPRPVQLPLSLEDVCQELREELRRRRPCWDLILIDAAEITTEPLELARWVRAVGDQPRDEGAEGPLAPITGLALVCDEPIQRPPNAFFELGLDVTVLAAVPGEPARARGPLRALTEAWDVLRDRAAPLGWRAGRSWQLGLQSTWRNTLDLARYGRRRAEELWWATWTGLDTRFPWPVGTARLFLGEDGELSEAELCALAGREEHDLAGSSRNALTRGLDGWARALTKRRVGVALGGGGAQGLLHHELLRRLEEEQVPVDIVSGTSAGSYYGSYYVTLGLDGLRLARRHWWMMAFFLPLGILDSRFIQAIIWADLGTVQLGDLAQTFLPTATNADTGKEWNFRRGTIASTTRASSSLPPVAPAIIDGCAYVDGAFVANVPIRALDDEGALIRVASNPAFPVPERIVWGVLRLPGLGPLLRPWNMLARAMNAYHGLKLLMRTVGDVGAAAGNVVLYKAEEASEHGSTSWGAGKEIMGLARASTDLHLALANVRSRWLLNLGGREQRMALFRWDGKQGSVLNSDLALLFPPGAGELDPFGEETLKALADWFSDGEQRRIRAIRVWANPHECGRELADKRASYACAELLRFGAKHLSARAAEETPGKNPLAEVDPHFRRGTPGQTDLVFQITDLWVSTETQQQLEIERLLQATEDALLGGNTRLSRLLGLEAARRTLSLTLASEDRELVARLRKRTQDSLSRILARRGRVRGTPDPQPEGPAVLAWSPNRRYLAAACAQSTFCVYEVRGDGRLRSDSWRPREHDASSMLALCWSPSGDRLAVVTVKNLSVYSLGFQLELLWQHPHDAWQTGWVEFAPSGEELLGPYTACVVGIFATETGELRRELDHGQDVVWEARWSHDGRFVATRRAQSVDVWARAAANAEEPRTLPLPEQRTVRLGWHPCELWLAVACAEGARVWAPFADGVATIPAGRPLAGHSGLLRNIAWSSDGTTLVTASNDAKGRLYCRPGSESWAWELTTVLVGHKAAVTGAAWHPQPESSLLLTWGEDGRAIVWDAETGQPRAELHGHSISVAEWRPKDGALVVTRGARLKVWDPLYAECEPSSRWGRGAGATGSTQAMLLVASGGDRPHLVRWTRQGSRSFLVFHDHLGANGRVLHEGPQAPGQLQLASAGNTLAAFSANTLRFWKLDALDQGPKMVPLECGLSRLALNSDGTAAAYVLADDDSQVQVCNVEQPTRRTTLGDPVAPPEKHVQVVAWHPQDPRRLATAHWRWGGFVSLWDCRPGDAEPQPTAIVRTDQGKNADALRGLAWSPNGKYLATSSNASAPEGRVLIYEDGSWDAPLGASKEQIQTWNLAWRADSRCLATSAAGSQLRLFRVPPDSRSPKTALAGEGRTLEVFELDWSPGKTMEHPSAVVSLAWQGERLVSLGGEDRVVVWDVETGEATQTYGHLESIHAFACFPSAKLIATLSRGGTLRLGSSDLLSLCKMVGKAAQDTNYTEMSEALWRRHLLEGEAPRPSWPFPPELLKAAANDPATDSAAFTPPGAAS